jgi:hypothetical protein
MYDFSNIQCLLFIHSELQDLNIVFFKLLTILAHENVNYYLLRWFTIVLYAERYYTSVFSLPKMDILHGSRYLCMKDGCTPAYLASQNGHTKTLALLLANIADINVADNVHAV